MAKSGIALIPRRFLPRRPRPGKSPDRAPPLDAIPFATRNPIGQNPAGLASGSESG
jgi:hypothetical protein